MTPDKNLDRAEVIRRFDELIDQHGGTFVSASKALGCSNVALGQYRAGRHPIPGWLLDQLGVETVYREKSH